MKQIFLLFWLVLLSASFGPASASRRQTAGDPAPPAEQYRRMVRLIGQKQYTEAISQGRILLDRPNAYDQTYKRIVESARASGRFELAQEAFRALLEAEPPNFKGLYGLGLVYLESSDYARAIDAFQQCLREIPEFSPALLELLSAYRRSGNLAAAEIYLNEQLGLRPRSAALHVGLGWYFARTAKLDDAVKEFETALSLDPRRIEACYYQASTLSSAERSEDSLRALEKCLPALNAELNEEDQNLFLGLKGRNLLRLGHHTEAAKIFLQLSVIAQGMGDRFLEESALGFLGNIYILQSDHFQALRTFQRALEVAKSSDNPVSTTNSGRSLSNMGQIYFQLGDWAEARSHYEKGLEIAEKTNDLGGQANALSYLGELLAAQNDAKAAISFYNRALEAEKKRAGPTPQSFYYNALYRLYLRSEDYVKAKETIEQAIQNARALDIRLMEPGALNSLGELHLRLKQPEQAIKTYEEALQAAIRFNLPSSVWITHAGMAAAYQSLGQLDKARDAYKESINALEKIRHRLNTEEDKAGFFQDKVDVYKKLVGVLLALSAQNAQDRSKAEAFSAAERARARAFSDLLAETKVSLEQSLDAAVLKQQQPLQQAVSNINSKLLKARARPPERQDKAEIDKLENELRESDKTLADWWRERNRRYADLKYPEPANLSQTQRLLGPDQVMLAYTLGSEQSYLFAISRKEYQVWELPAAETLNQQAEDLLAALIREQSEANDWRLAAAEMYRALIEPAAKFLRRRAATRELILLPDGALHRIPFEVLLEPTPKSATDFTKLPYLVKRYALSYAPSATVLKSLKEAPQNPARKPKAIIVFADPLYEQPAPQPTAALAARRAVGGEQQWKFDRLLNSAREAQGIAQIFGASGGADLRLRKQANETEVKSPEDRLLGYRIVHFSVHGLVNERRPRLSGLVLTLPPVTQSADAPAADDGVLSAYEIFNLKMNAELVTLSACETGLGKEVRGEGLMSLARGFMYAGTSSVLASLWKVDDAGTTDLMVDFYRFWRQGKRVGGHVLKLNKAGALREAQLKAIAAGSQPFYWAPFVLLGRSD